MQENYMQFTHGNLMFTMAFDSNDAGTRRRNTTTPSTTFNLTNGPPGIIASIVGFVAFNVWAAFTVLPNVPSHWPTDQPTQIIFLAILMLQALYYFWVEVWTENNPQLKIELSQCSKFEFVLRIAQRLLLTALSTVMLRGGASGYFAAILVLNMLYIFWHYLTRRCKDPQKRALRWVDLIGVVGAAVAWWSIWSKDQNPFADWPMLTLGVGAFLFLAQLLVGFLIIGHPKNHIFKPVDRNKGMLT